jgi:hypothetical protein
MGGALCGNTGDADENLTPRKPGEADSPQHATVWALFLMWRVRQVVGQGTGMGSVDDNEETARLLENSKLREAWHFPLPVSLLLVTFRA